MFWFVRKAIKRDAFLGQQHEKRDGGGEARKQETFTRCSCLLTRYTWSTFINPYTLRELWDHRYEFATATRKRTAEAETKRIFSTATINQLLHNCCSTRFRRLSSTLKRRSFVMHNSPFTISHSSRFFRLFVVSPNEPRNENKKKVKQRIIQKIFSFLYCSAQFGFFCFFREMFSRFPLRAADNRSASHVTQSRFVLLFECHSPTDIYVTFAIALPTYTI